MTTGSNHPLTDLMDSLRQQGLRGAFPENPTVVSFRKVADLLLITDYTPDVEERAPAGDQYLAVPPQQLSNGNFDANLTGWTEDNDGTVTATSVHETGQGLVFAKQGGLGSIKFAVTDASGADANARRYASVAASVGQVWNFESWAYFTARSNTRMGLVADFRNGGGTLLDSETSTFLDAVNAGFVQLKIENFVAPANTASLRCYLVMVADGADATGTGYFGKARAEVGATTISARATRIICNEWVARE